MSHIEHIKRFQKYISNKQSDKYQNGSCRINFFQEENIKQTRWQNIFCSLGTIALSFNEIDWNMILDKKKKKEYGIMRSEMFLLDIFF